MPLRKLDVWNILKMLKTLVNTGEVGVMIGGRGLGEVFKASTKSHGPAAQ